MLSGWSTRSAGFHGEFIPVQKIRRGGRKPCPMRFAMHSSKGCIDSARMYQLGFAVCIAEGILKKHE
jgi:hypothetical protein